MKAFQKGTDDVCNAFCVYVILIYLAFYNYIHKNRTYKVFHQNAHIACVFWVYLFDQMKHHIRHKGMAFPSYIKINH